MFVLEYNDCKLWTGYYLCCHNLVITMCLFAVTAKSKLDAAISDLLSAASQQQRDVLQQLQDDLVTLLQQVVIPQLTSVAAGASSSSSREAGLKEPGLSAVTRIMKGNSCCYCQLLITT